MINPLDFTYNWTAIGWSASTVAALLAGHWKPIPKAWDKVKTLLTPEAVKVKAEMEILKAKFETENSKKILDHETRLKALEAKIIPPA